MEFWKNKNITLKKNDYILYSLQPMPVTLSELFPESILKIINHEQQDKQSIYNTDSTRYNYVVKTSTEVWNEDKSGVKFTVKNNKNVFLLFLILGNIYRYFQQIILLDLY
jgi:hypothetical protein